MLKIQKDTLDHCIEKFKDSARQAGIKLTPQRLEIFREVAGSLDHPTADSVFQSVRKGMPTVSLDTVYRTLSTLSKLGLISTLGPRHESVRFDANPDHHHHFVCLNCGLARDFKSDSLNNIHIPDKVKSFGIIEATHVEVRGICNECAKNKKGKILINNIKRIRRKEK